MASARPCRRCGEDTVHDAAYCHRCGAALAGGRGRPHVLVVGLVVAVLVAVAAAWTWLPPHPGAFALAFGSSAVLLPADAAPSGTVVGPLPSGFRDALGVDANPARLPPEAVEGFSEIFGTRPDEAWVEFVAVPGTDGTGVLLFSFHWKDDDAAAAAARAFVASAGCRDVDVALAGGADVAALVAVGAREETLEPTVSAVADALVARAPALADMCAPTRPALDTPQLALEAAPRAENLTRGAPLAVLVHGGGPAVDWSDASLRLARDGTPTVAVSFSADGDCATASLVPTGDFGPGDRLTLCAADDRWEPGARLGARLVARADGREVWAGEVAVA